MYEMKLLREDLEAAARVVMAMYREGEREFLHGKRTRAILVHFLEDRLTPTTAHGMVF